MPLFAWILLGVFVAFVAYFTYVTIKDNLGRCPKCHKLRWEKLYKCDDPDAESVFVIDCPTCGESRRTVRHYVA